VSFGYFTGDKNNTGVVKVSSGRVHFNARDATMSLKQLIESYLRIGKAFGAAVALADFGLSATEIEKVFSGYNEDYHISRFFKFSNQSGAAFSIDSEPVTHIVIDSGIDSIL
jgi:hypothetical protein